MNKRKPHNKQTPLLHSTKGEINTSLLYKQGPTYRKVGNKP